MTSDKKKIWQIRDMHLSPPLIAKIKGLNLQGKSNQKRGQQWIKQFNKSLEMGEQMSI